MLVRGWWIVVLACVGSVVWIVPAGIANDLAAASGKLDRLHFRLTLLIPNSAGLSSEACNWAKRA